VKKKKYKEERGGQMRDKRAGKSERKKW